MLWWILDRRANLPPARPSQNRAGHRSEPRPRSPGTDVVGAGTLDFASNATVGSSGSSTTSRMTTMARMAPRKVVLHGHELSYVDSGSGPAVLFIHGILGSQ